MTKMVSLRVIVPADDEAPIADVQKRLREHLEGFGTEPLTGTLDGNGARARVCIGRRPTCCKARPSAPPPLLPAAAASRARRPTRAHCQREPRQRAR